jgi:hypothetical protein
VTTIKEELAKLRDLLSYDTELFLLPRECLLMLLGELEHQGTRAEAAEEEVRDLCRRLAAGAE